MSQGSQFGADPFGASGGPPKKKMSTGTKVLLIIGSVFGVLALLCCGGVGFVYNRTANAVTDEPEKVQAIAERIVTIELPPDMRAQGGADMDLVFIKFKMAFYQGDDHDSLVLMQIPGQIPADKMREKLDNEKEKQSENRKMHVVSREIRNVDIDGQDVPFEFTIGVYDKAHQGRQVSGVFPGREGTVMVMYEVREEDWNEERVMRMLRSIKK